MFAAKQVKSSSQVDTLIGSGTRIQGDVHFSGGLQVDGGVTGNIISQDAGTLVLSEAAVVEGEIRVARAVVNGKVTGPIYASDNLELQTKARVTGDIYYGALEVQLGAIVQGRLIHGTDERGADKVVSLVTGGVD